MTKVSIIIPAYNASDCICMAIESILNQKYDESIEIIVVDDGSTDNTKESLTYLIDRDIIKYFYKFNGGASSARNYGIKKANGELIGFLDADDIFLPEMLSYCVPKIVDRNLDLVSVDCYLTHLDDNGEKIRTELLDYGWVRQPSDALFLDFMKRGAIGGPHKALFRREVFKKVGLFDTRLKIYEDLDFWIRVARAQMRWEHIPIPLLECYRAQEGSLFTSSRELNQDCRVMVLNKYKKEAIALDPGMKIILGEQLFNFGKNYLLEHKNYGKALTCFWDSLLTDFQINRFIRSAYHFFRPE